MPGEIIVAVAGGLLRFLGQIFLQLFFECLIQGPGYVVCRLFGRKANPSDFAAGMVGLLFWCCVAAIAYGTYQFLARS